MGFSVSGATVVVFLGMFISFGMMYTAANNGFERVHDAYGDEADDELTRQNTGISVASAAANDGSTTLTVAVDNTGSTALSVNDTDILINGKYIQLTDENMSPVEVDENPETDLWLPGETLSFEYDYGSEPERVKVVTESGVSSSARVEVV